VREGSDAIDNKTVGWSKKLCDPNLWNELKESRWLRLSVYQVFGQSKTKRMERL
jgi:hypothetical protein